MPLLLRLVLPPRPSPDWLHNNKGTPPLPLDLPGKILTVIEAGIEDLLEVFDET